MQSLSVEGGPLRSTTAKSAKMSPQDVTLHNPNPFAIIPLRANYPKTIFVRAIPE